MTNAEKAILHTNSGLLRIPALKKDSTQDRVVQNADKANESAYDNKKINTKSKRNPVAKIKEYLKYENSGAYEEYCHTEKKKAEAGNYLYNSAYRLI